MLFRTEFGKGCTARKFPFPHDNQRRICIQNVLLRPLNVIRRVGFVEFVMLWDETVLSEAAVRTPAAVLETVLDGKIQRGPVHARLSTRNNFHLAAFARHWDMSLNRHHAWRTK